MLQQRIVELLHSCQDSDYGCMSESMPFVTQLFICNETADTYQLIRKILHCSQNWNANDNSIQHKLELTSVVVKHKRQSYFIDMILSHFAAGISSLQVM